jgi:hypothetical protein
LRLLEGGCFRSQERDQPGATGKKPGLCIPECSI